MALVSGDLEEQRSDGLAGVSMRVIMSWMCRAAVLHPKVRLRGEAA